MNLKATAIESMVNRLSLQSNPTAANVKEETDNREIPVIGTFAETISNALNEIFAKNGGLPSPSKINSMGRDLDEPVPNQYQFELKRRDVIDDFDNSQATLLTIQSEQGNQTPYTNVTELIAEECCQDPKRVVIAVDATIIPPLLDEMLKSYVEQDISISLVLMPYEENELESLQFNDNGLSDLLEEYSDKISVYVATLKD